MKLKRSLKAAEYGSLGSVPRHYMQLEFHPLAWLHEPGVHNENHRTYHMLRTSDVPPSPAEKWQ